MRPTPPYDVPPPPRSRPPPCVHHASLFITFLRSGINLEANVVAHEFERPFTDPQPLLGADTAPNFTLRVDINSTPVHHDTRSWVFLTLLSHLTIIPKILLPDPHALPPTIRLIADAHCILPINQHISAHHHHSPHPFAIHVLPSARISTLVPHASLPIFISTHTCQPASRQVPLHIADIHPGLGSFTHVLFHLQQLHIVKIISCLSQHHRAGLLHRNFPCISHKINTHHLTSTQTFHAVSKAHGLIFSNEHKTCNHDFQPTFLMRSSLSTSSHPTLP